MLQIATRATRKETKELSTMAVRQHDDRPSWKVSQAARVLIVGKDEQRLAPQLQRWMLRWMRRSPENVANLFAVARIDRELGRLKLLDRSAELSVSQPRPDGIAFVTRRAVLVTGAVCVALLVLGVAISMLPEGGPPIRHVTLADGTIMHVLRDSDVDIEYRDDVRLVNLPRGAAVFEVAKDPARPFMVRSKLSDSIAVGTRFGISTDSVATTTTVSEGEVRIVAPAGADPMTGTSVRAGEELRVAAGSPRPEPVMAVDAERKISWSAGWLEFDGETVGEAVRTFNRFSDVRIEIKQPQLSDVRLRYYRFEINRPESFAIALGTALNAPVKVNSARKVIYIGDARRTPK